ncbi:MAG TPA: 50S ribosomal protein L16 [Candidatus Magasanikbacteria bacterium]|uniref:Large ribosomal subunit protein uL16 n=2 Tax=Candidatus Magasanikiibacteriota TaxID=1752731 RepID=A0A0G0WJ03_9BACT|nr:MAG: 50S ribosomal protein L16 [Candidatus Magasanikbacteria bacterium GW2011_GWC2_41_17]KKS12879.1 MAG: 50S ribosomal protein L16 [Candidatus Magasanikbacteria bacterium GW2011_GWA2_41_55]HBV57934.1 50S ribosomal protein L16 [Candidatus Magasanikbacteria bacterium]HBX16299.1 50S ribosomal protein L16 [Candidatus Magasanikbacteria bacterium]
MLYPKKVKHRKWHKGRRRRTGISTTKTTVDYGAFGLKALEHGWVTARQIESARRTITHFFKKSGKLWIRIFPDKPVTNHGNESVMGSGKGAVDHFVAAVKPGIVMFEVDGITEEVAKDALKMAGHKLPVKTIVVKAI